MCLGRDEIAVSEDADAWEETWPGRLIGTACIATGLALLFGVFSLLGLVTKTSPLFGAGLLVVAFQTAWGLWVSRTRSRVESIVVLTAAGAFSLLHPAALFVELVAVLLAVQPLFSAWLMAHGYTHLSGIRWRALDLAYALGVLGLVIWGPR